MKCATREEYLASLPKKPSGAGALFFNALDEILILQTAYKSSGWEIPGGIIEPMESPKHAAEREITEELGLKLKIGRLLCIDYKNIGNDMDSYQMIFDGGLLSPRQIAEIKTDFHEVAAYRFCDNATAYSLLETTVAQRVKMALQARSKNETYYLEHGQII